MKIQLKTLKVFSTVAALVLAGAAANAQAEDKNVRTMRNSAHLVSLLDGVIPERVNKIVEMLETGKLSRIAPEYPVVLIEQVDGTILFYQGQPDFKGKPARALVDDAGVRFGAVALERGRISKTGWLSVTLNNKKHRMYCHNLSPFTACTLQL